MTVCPGILARFGVEYRWAVLPLRAVLGLCSAWAVLEWAVLGLCSGGLCLGCALVGCALVGCAGAEGSHLPLIIIIIISVVSKGMGRGKVC